MSAWSHAADVTTVDAKQRRVVDGAAGGRRRRMRAVSFGIARRADAAGTKFAGRCADDRKIRVQEHIGANQLVIARERGIARNAEPACKWTARRRIEAVIDKRWVLGPHAGVKHADDHAFTGLNRSADRRPDLRGAEEAGRHIGQRLCDRILLD